MSSAHTLPRFTNLHPLRAYDACTVSLQNPSSGYTNQQLPSSTSRGDIPLSLRNILGGKLIDLVYNKLNHPFDYNLRPRREEGQPTLTAPALTTSITWFTYQANSSGVAKNGFNVGLVTFKHFGMSLNGANGGTAPYLAVHPHNPTE